MFSSTFDYRYRALELTQNNERLHGIVDHLLVQHLGAAYALAPGWQVEFDLPIVWANVFTEPVLAAADSSLKINLGDALFRTRINLVNREKNTLIGLALVPYITLPLGGKEHFVGDPLPTGGGVLAFDVTLSKRAFFGINIGAEAREHFVLFEYDIPNKLILGGGFSYELQPGWFGKVSFHSGTTFQNTFESTPNSPTQASVGTHFRLGKSGLRGHLSSDFAVIQAAGSPLFHGLMGVSYTGVGNPFKKNPETRALQSEVVFDQSVLKKEWEKMVVFPETSMQLTHDMQTQLNELARVIKAHSEVSVIRVTGYGDRSLQAMDRLALSLKRASEVAIYLRKQNVPSKKIIIESGEGGMDAMLDEPTLEGLVRIRAE